jgi:hypothetical protein
MSQRAHPIERELQRCRRFGRPLSLVRVRPRDADAARLAAALEEAGREVDRVWPVGGDVVVLLVDADRAAARAFVERACRPHADSLAEEPATASFPDDGLTGRALIAALHGDASARVAAPPVPPDPGRVWSRDPDPGAAAGAVAKRADRELERQPLRRVG